MSPFNFSAVTSGQTNSCVAGPWLEARGSGSGAPQRTAWPAARLSLAPPGSSARSTNWSLLKVPDPATMEKTSGSRAIARPMEQRWAWRRSVRLRR